MCAQMHLHTFIGPDVICTLIYVSIMTSNMLIYEISDDTIQINCIQNSLKYK